MFVCILVWMDKWINTVGGFLRHDKYIFLKCQYFRNTGSTNRKNAFKYKFEIERMIKKKIYHVLRWVRNTTIWRRGSRLQLCCVFQYVYYIYVLHTSIIPIYTHICIIWAHTYIHAYIMASVSVLVYLNMYIICVYICIVIERHWEFSALR